MALTPSIIHGHDRRFQIRLMEEIDDDDALRRVICAWDSMNECRAPLPHFDKNNGVGDLFNLFKQYCNELNDQHEDRMKYEREISNFTGKTIFVQG